MSFLVRQIPKGFAKPRFRWFAVVTVVFGASDAVNGQATIREIGEGFEPSAISADGKVVLGTGQKCTLLLGSAAKWTVEAGTVCLGDLPGGYIQSNAIAASADGSVITGWSSSNASGTEGFRWTHEAGMQGLGYSAGHVPTPSCMSDDGRVIIGRADTGRIWIDEGPWLMLSLHDVTGVSRDGAIVVGGDRYAYIAQLSGSTATDVRPLVTNQGNIFVGATTVSSDGTTVVGAVRKPFFGPPCQNCPGFGAFRWTEKSGLQILELGEGRTQIDVSLCTPMDVSVDGQIVIGVCDHRQPFIWELDTGLRSLKEVLEHDYCLDLQGWELEYARGISDDGSSIIGTANGRGWLLELGTAPPVFVGSEPQDGSIDARQDYSSSGVTRQGTNRVRVRFTRSVRDELTDGPLDARSFTAVNSAGIPTNIVEIQSIDGSDKVFDVLFEDPIIPGEWTMLIPHVERADGRPYLPLGCNDTLTIGFLPGDVNGDGTVGPLDILALIDSLTGANPLPLERTDINRSGATNASDILRLIDLMNGANTTRPWLGATLPTLP